MYCVYQWNLRLNPSISSRAEIKNSLLHFNELLEVRTGSSALSEQLRLFPPPKIDWEPDSRHSSAAESFKECTSQRSFYSSPKACNESGSLESILENVFSRTHLEEGGILSATTRKGYPIPLAWIQWHIRESSNLGLQGSVWTEGCILLQVKPGSHSKHWGGRK